MFYNKKTRKWRTSKKKESRDEGAYCFNKNK